MKASLAFAIGLWSGGLLVGGVWLFHHRQGPASVDPARPPTVGRTTASAGSEELNRLTSDNARLVAEVDRLRQTLEEFYRDQEIPETPPPLQPSPAPTPAVVAPAVADPPQPDPADLTISLLEEQALENKQVAIDALVLATDESYQALMRLLRSEQLNDRNRAAIESYLASLLEQYLAETDARTAE